MIGSLMPVILERASHCRKTPGANDGKHPLNQHGPRNINLGQPSLPSSCCRAVLVDEPKWHLPLGQEAILAAHAHQDVMLGAVLQQTSQRQELHSPLNAQLAAWLEEERRGALPFCALGGALVLPTIRA